MQMSELTVFDLERNFFVLKKSNLGQQKKMGKASVHYTIARDQLIGAFPSGLEPALLYVGFLSFLILEEVSWKI